MKHEGTRKLRVYWEVAAAIMKHGRTRQLTIEDVAGQSHCNIMHLCPCQQPHIPRITLCRQLQH